MNPQNIDDYNEGDRVRVEKMTQYEGKLWGCEELFVGHSRRTLAALLADGFTITTIEKAPHPLPIEPGLYVTDSSDLGGVFVLYRLDTYNQWFVMWSAMSPEKRTREEIIFGTSGSKLFRIEPAHTTAKKVLSRVSEGVPTSPAYVASGMANIIGMIGVEFGVGGNE